MTVSLLGGPLDGAETDAPSHLPLYMIATNVAEKPIYKRMCCLSCQCNHDAIPYLFVGYEVCASAEAN
jgi:hypothetical protein